MSIHFSTFAFLGTCTWTFSSAEQQFRIIGQWATWNHGRFFSSFAYLCHGAQPAVLQKPQVLTGFKVIMIVQHDPPSTIILCMCEAGNVRNQGAR
jgi:hypothetical protein